MLMCDRCIRAIRSRGETIFVGNLVHADEIKPCNWCEELNDELYTVKFEQSLCDEFFAEDEFEI
jgi:hypothetical protein